jgi:transposase-like protein
VPAPNPAAALYRGYRFPEIISYAVWLYLRFALSLRDVEELLAERGEAVTYDTIGQWVRRFGPCSDRSCGDVGAGRGTSCTWTK